MAARDLLHKACNFELIIKVSYMIDTTQVV